MDTTSSMFVLWNQKICWNIPNIAPYVDVPKSTGCLWFFFEIFYIFCKNPTNMSWAPCRRRTRTVHNYRQWPDLHRFFFNLQNSQVQPINKIFIWFVSFLDVPVNMAVVRATKKETNANTKTISAAIRSCVGVAGGFGLSVSLKIVKIVVLFIFYMLRFFDFTKKNAT